MSSCISLKGSTMCPSFVSFNALIPASIATNVHDAASFDSYINVAITVSNTPFTFGGTVRTDASFGCPNWDGTQLRYLQSSLCAYLVADGVGVVADSDAVNAPGTPCNPASTVVPLCQSSMNKFGTSWNTVFNNKTNCPSPGPLALGSASLSSVMTAYTSALSTATSTCLVAEGTLEKQYCGFVSAAEAKAYCATASLTADPCCSSFAPPTTTIAATTTAAPTAAISTTAVATTTAAAAASTTSLPIPIIAGAAGGVVLLIIIGITVWCCMRRKKAAAAESSYDDTHTYGMEDRQNFPNKAAPMGYGAAPVPSNNGNTCEAVFDYTPNMSDELATMVGDKVLLKAEYDDGWGFGVNLRTRKEGILPLDVLDKFAQGNNQAPQEYNQRASSMYGASEYGNAQSMYDANQSMYDANQSMYEPNGQQSGYKPNNQSMYSTYEAGTDSVYYGNNTESMYAPGPAAGGKDVHDVAYDFTPEQRDEIELRVGDKVQLQHQYDDGWAKGVNLSIGATGLFPLDCLAGFDAPQEDEKGNKKHNNRVSSIYGESEYGNSVYYGDNNTQSMYQSEYGNSVYYGNENGQDSVYYGNGQDSVYYGNNTESVYAPAPKGRR